MLNQPSKLRVAGSIPAGRTIGPIFYACCFTPSRLAILALTRIFDEQFCCNSGFAALAREVSFVNCERDKQDVRNRRDSRR